MEGSAHTPMRRHTIDRTSVALDTVIPRQAASMRDQWCPRAERVLPELHYDSNFARGGNAHV